MSTATDHFVSFENPNDAAVSSTLTSSKKDFGSASIGQMRPGIRQNLQHVLNPVNPIIASQNQLQANNHFQKAAQFTVPMPEHTFEHPVPHVDVQFNFESFENAGMLGTQDMKMTAGTPACMGLFDAIGSLSKDVGFSLGGPKPPSALAISGQAQATLDTTQNTPSAPSASFEMNPSPNMFT